MAAAAGPAVVTRTQPPGEALSPKHEAFVQAYVTNGMNATEAYKSVYPKHGSEKAAARQRKGRRGERSSVDRR
jgi:hypothetical protein